MAGSSPAMFFRSNADKIYMSPICGTITRGENQKEDQHNIAQLLNCPKSDLELKKCIDLDIETISAFCTDITIKVGPRVRKLHHDAKCLIFVQN
jgi:anthranilate/para-aminobenzoate synthase component I